MLAPCVRSAILITERKAQAWLAHSEGSQKALACPPGRWERRPEGFWGRGESYYFVVVGWPLAAL